MIIGLSKMRNFLEKIYKKIKLKKTLALFLALVVVMSAFPVKGIFAEDLTWGDLTPEQQAQIIKKSTPLGQITSGLSDAVNWAVGGLVSAAVTKMTLAFAQIFGHLIQLEAKVLAWVIDVEGFTKLAIVQSGWKLCRDFANLFFIAILIYIAFATILRVQKYDAKKMLFKVIALAIIINFSLMIGGIIIDFSQVLFKYFIFAPLSEKNGVGFGERLADQLRLQTFFGNEYNQVNQGGLGKVGDAFLKLVFILIFFGLVTIVFGAVALVLFIRNFWLWILLILSPLAWFLSILPSQLGVLSGLASKWWTNFLKWCFIAPVMGFFIFLSFQITSNSGFVDQEKVNQKWEKIEAQNKGSEQIFSYNNKSNNTIFNVSNVLYLLATLAFLVGGLMAGQSLGLQGANGILTGAQKTIKNSQKWMGRKAMQTAPVRGVGNVLMGMGNIPLVGGVFKRAGMATQRGTVAAKGDDKKKAEDRIKYMNDEQLKSNFNSFNDWEKQAAAKKLGNDKLDQKQFEAMQKVYSRQGYEKELKDLNKAAPHFTSDFKKEADKLAEEKQKFLEKDKNYKNDYEGIDNNIKGLEKEKEIAESALKVNNEKIAQSKSGAGFIKPDITKIEKENEEHTKTINLASEKLDELRKNKDRLNVDREKNKEELNKIGTSILERFKDIDISKLSDISKIMEKTMEGGIEKYSAQAEAILYAVEHGSAGNIFKLISNIERKDNGKKDISRTMEARKNLGIKIMEDLHSEGGIDAVLKMTKINSSPSAMAGGYSFNDLVNGMNSIKADMKNDIILRAKKQKKTDEVISRIVEEVKEEKGSNGKEEKEKKEENKTEDKKEKL